MLQRAPVSILNLIVFFFSTLHPIVHLSSGTASAGWVMWICNTSFLNHHLSWCQSCVHEDGGCTLLTNRQASYRTCGSQGRTFSLIPVMVRVFATPGAVLPFSRVRVLRILHFFSDSVLRWEVLHHEKRVLASGTFVLLPYCDGFG